MKKAVYLLSVLALVGCSEEDVKATFDGDARVFAVKGVQIKEGGWMTVPAGYHDIQEVVDTYSLTLPSGMPDGDGAALTGLGIDFDPNTTCGKIDITGDVCFSDSGMSDCMPEEFEMLGLAVFTIDKDDLSTAVEHGFYPTVAASLGGLYADIDYNDYSCSALEELKQNN